MKSAILFFLSTIVSVGSIAQVNDSNRHAKNLHRVNSVQITALDGRPIGFFLNHPEIDNYSKKFYKGEYCISGDSIPSNILDSLFTENPETRPFYFFIFNQIVEMSNGKMEEKVASRCLRYIEKYPCEFFNSFNKPEININVVKWTTYIGKELKDRNSFAAYKGSIDPRIKASCLDIQDLAKSFFVEVRMCLVMPNR